MSNVPNTSLHSFSNGETVTQDMLNQDIQVLQSAVNDNDTRITTLQGANQGALSKVPSGTAFPASPQQGWIFFRTDVGATGTFYIYDTTNNWNSDPSLIKLWIQNNLGLGVSQTSNTISGSVDLNTKTTSGFYFVSGTVTNQPVTGTSGYLLVQAGNANSLCSQMYICDGTANIYQRIYTGGAWGAWKQVSGSPSLTFSTLQNGWVNYGTGYNTFQFGKDASNYVHLRGLVQSGTQGSIIATLPTGYRPANSLLLHAQDGSQYGVRVDVNADGTIKHNNVTPFINYTSYISLDSLPPFLAEQ